MLIHSTQSAFRVEEFTSNTHGRHRAPRVLTNWLAWIPHALQCPLWHLKRIMASTSTLHLAQKYTVPSQYQECFAESLQ
jgi:hypothetical protein